MDNFNSALTLSPQNLDHLGLQFTVVIASTGRAAVLHEMVRRLALQCAAPGQIVLSVADHSDVLPETLKYPSVRVALGPKGSSHQRNTGIDCVPDDHDVVFFLDDDVELCADYIGKAIAFMMVHPEVSAMSGLVVADGAVSGEISRARAIEILSKEPHDTAECVRPQRGLYGCYVVRARVARKVRFDERLRLYAYMEDRDFGIRCAALGPVVTTNQCRLVHLGVRTGRVSSRRWGYVQVMNPYYLRRKGVLGTLESLCIMKSICANLAGLIIRDKVSRIERARALRGNLRGLIDAARFGPQPELVERVR